MKDDLLLYIMISQQIQIWDVRAPRVQLTGASACWPRAQSSIWAKPQRHTYAEYTQPNHRATTQAAAVESLCALPAAVRAPVIYGLATMQLVYRTRPPTSVSLVSCWRVTCENSCTRLVPHCCYQPASIGEWDGDINPYSTAMPREWVLKSQCTRLMMLANGLRPADGIMLMLRVPTLDFIS
jgi:hypothetical protein